MSALFPAGQIQIYHEAVLQLALGNAFVDTATYSGHVHGSYALTLLSGLDLSAAVKRVMSGRRALCAVAFWGRGSEALLGSSNGRDVRVICNLKMGGTNPKVIENMIHQGLSIRQSDVLHAKVYIGDVDAVVTSANASINGLGFEAEGQSGWIEVGTVIPAVSALTWFEQMWSLSRSIQVPNDINAAMLIFKKQKDIEGDLSNVTVLSSADGADTSTYYGVSVTRAITLVLNKNQRSMTSAEIAEELRLGGLSTAALQLTSSINSALRDGKQKLQFLRVSRGTWALPEWPEFAELAQQAKQQAMTSRVKRQSHANPDKIRSERVRAGLAAARERGVSGGSPGKLTAEQTKQVIEKRLSGVKTSQVAAEYNLSIGGVLRILQKHYRSNSK